MKPRILPNGLSVRATRCLAAAGVPAEKAAVLLALETGRLYPYFQPSLYGKKTHEEVCRWVGIDESSLSPPIPDGAMPAPVPTGLSYRANRFLHRSGIRVEKDAVRKALQDGTLRPGKSPLGYGRQTHAELCGWVGVQISRDAGES